MTELELLQAEKREVRRVLCAAFSETTDAAARRVVRRNLEMRVRLKRLVMILEQRNLEIDLAREVLASLKEVLG